MTQRICSNPECHKTYDTDERYDSSMGCCSFDCWEKQYCKEPANEVFEEIKIQ